jgi:hypothetical protein
LFFEKEDVQKKKGEPDACDFAGTERKQTARCREDVTGQAEVSRLDFAREKDQQPSAASKDESQTVGPAGNVIDRSAMHRMNDPEKRDEKSRERHDSRSVRLRNAGSDEQFPQQKVEKNTAEDVQQNVR